MSYDNANQSNGKNIISATKQMSLKNASSLMKKIKTKDVEENEDNYVDDDEEQIYNDVFKDVIKGVMF